MTHLGLGIGQPVILQSISTKKWLSGLSWPVSSASIDTISMDLTDVGESGFKLGSFVQLTALSGTITSADKVTLSCR